MKAKVMAKATRVEVEPQQTNIIEVYYFMLEFLVKFCVLQQCFLLLLKKYTSLLDV